MSGCRAWPQPTTREAAGLGGEHQRPGECSRWDTFALRFREARKRRGAASALRPSASGWLAQVCSCAQSQFGGGQAFAVVPSRSRSEHWAALRPGQSLGEAAPLLQDPHPPPALVTPCSRRGGKSQTCSLTSSEPRGPRQMWRRHWGSYQLANPLRRTPTRMLLNMKKGPSGFQGVQGEQGDSGGPSSMLVTPHDGTEQGGSRSQRGRPHPSPGKANITHGLWPGPHRDTQLCRAGD